MTENVRLVQPSMELRDEYLKFYQEWIDSGENMVPWVISQDPSDFQGMLHFLTNNEKDEQPDQRVPDSTFWLITEDRKVVGAVNIRHRLNERLLNCGGHIGYGIRPSERRKGYAAKLLALSLEKTRALGIDKVLVVCDEWNIASARTILKNGGRPDTKFVEEDGNVVLRFWIDNGTR
ncbi:GNAT family N-acetyltransferase [Paenibacillus physcomitrellae]|uniref:Acetyltransferase n=1 Tax=Paenibacillus physcomitrellae TaxID=1619311 RepID=A0ABQ1FNN2_9BACL|nr:GNAT family N-acetyltransferase [Paenibacillus physcomitrellae]GGA24098.1 acetyltransferase [Paenibacillus physcomitrellae]